MTALLLALALHTGTQAQERTKDRMRQDAKEVEKEVDKAAVKTERAVDKAVDRSGKAIDKAAEKTERAVIKAADRAEEGTLKAADKVEMGTRKAVENTEKAVDRAVSGNGAAKRSDENSGRGNAYGKDKEGLKGREFGQQRASEARSREQLSSTVTDHERKINESRLKIREASDRLEAERKAGKVSAEEYRERKERIAKAERGVADLQRKVDQAKRVR